MSDLDAKMQAGTDERLDGSKKALAVAEAQGEQVFAPFPCRSSPCSAATRSGALEME